MMSVEQIYERYIKVLTPSEKKRLMHLMRQEWEDKAPPSQGQALAASSILELHGLGREIWKQIDAQDYVDRLRGEWDSE